MTGRTMFEDASLWMVLGSMASTAGLLGLWFDRSGSQAEDIEDWQSSQLH